MLEDARVVKAAEPYTRLLIRVPEAYLLLQHFEDATRPGLFVLDADGNPVDSISFTGLSGEDGAKQIAEWLDETRETPALATIRLKIEAKDMDVIADAVEELEGVEWAAETDESFDVAVTAGTATPTHVVAAVKKAGGSATVIEPVAVTFTARRKGAEWNAGDVSALPGVQAVTTGERPVAWCAPFLLDGKALTAAAPGWVADVEETVHRLKDYPSTPSGARVARYALAVNGVLAVFPDIAKSRITVVARPAVTKKRVADALVSAGVKPR